MYFLRKIRWDDDGNTCSLFHLCSVKWYKCATSLLGQDREQSVWLSVRASNFKPRNGRHILNQKMDILQPHVASSQLVSHLTLPEQDGSTRLLSLLHSFFSGAFYNAAKKPIICSLHQANLLVNTSNFCQCSISNLPNYKSRLQKADCSYNSNLYIFAHLFFQDFLVLTQNFD